MTIRDMSKIFRVNIGLSDHTIGSLNAISAIALGATVIEKHVTISKNDGGLDSIFSLEIKDFRKFVESCRNTKKIIGKVYYGPSKREKPSLKYRRSIYVSRNINKGEKITKNSGEWSDKPRLAATISWKKAYQSSQINTLEGFMND